MFYESVVASAIFFAVTCLGSGLKVTDNNRLHKLIRRAGEVVGEELDTLTIVAERRMLSKLQSILDNTGPAEEHIQWKTPLAQMHHRAPQEIISACGH